MTEPIKKPDWSRDELLGLLSVSGALAGLCITIVAFINTANKGGSTVVDDMLIMCAAGFLACIYLIVWALKTSKRRRALLIVKAVDFFFLTALTGMTVAGFFMVYTIW